MMEAGMPPTAIRLPGLSGSHEMPSMKKLDHAIHQ
jgi:hypothetical protein